LKKRTIARVVVFGGVELLSTAMAWWMHNKYMKSAVYVLGLWGLWGLLGMLPGTLLGCAGGDSGASVDVHPDTATSNHSGDTSTNPTGTTTTTDETDGTTPGTDMGSDSGTTPGTDMGSDSGTPPGTDSGTAPDSDTGADFCRLLPPEVRPYDPVHFALNQPIAPNPALDPRSDAIVARLAENVTLRPVSLGTHGESPAIYAVSDADPLYAVRVPDSGIDELFRVPVTAVSGSGSDAPVELLDRNHPTYGLFVELRLWQAVFDHANQVVTASGGGFFHYNADGVRLNPDDSPSLGAPFKGWGTGSGLSYMAGLIRPEEISAHEICHAIRFSYSNCHFTDTFRAPATKTDQPKGCGLSLSERGDPASWMEMGMRLQLDPAVDCDSRTAPRRNAAHDTTDETNMLRAICRAMQRYGLVALDGTITNGLMLYAEDAATADWEALLGPADIHTGYSFMLRDNTTATDGMTRDDTSGIPWHRLRVLAP